MLRFRRLPHVLQLVVESDFQQQQQQQQSCRHRLSTTNRVMNLSCVTQSEIENEVVKRKNEVLLTHDRFMEGMSDSVVCIHSRGSGSRTCSFLFINAPNLYFLLRSLWFVCS